MDLPEATRTARHHLGDTLHRCYRGGALADVWCVEATYQGAYHLGCAPTPEAAAVAVATQLRAAGWVPSHARLEWRHGAGKDYALVYRHEGLTLPMYRVFASPLPDDFGAESLNLGTSAYGPLAFVLAEVAAHCADRIPSLHLPPFPGASDV